jgi:haloalkane dehalogenase
MKILRTPEERFTSLPGFDFAPHYAELRAGIQVHYLDEGNPNAAPVLLMHGEPSWCYLYRKMIPPLVAAGHRCIAPDLVGLGRSDKPSDPSDYSYARHVDWMAELLFGQLNLREITLVCQDWGGLLGLRLLAGSPDRFSRVVVANTGLPTGEGPASEAFLAWQRFSRDSPEFPVGNIVSGGCATALPDDVIAAYNAPFPDDTFKACARVLPSLVPTSPEDPAHDANVRAWDVLRQFKKPLLCAFSDGDPITRGADRVFKERVPGARDQPHATIEGAGHFLQEDKGEALADVVASFIARTA